MMKSQLLLFSFFALLGTRTFAASLSQSIEGMPDSDLIDMVQVQPSESNLDIFEPSPTHPLVALGRGVQDKTGGQVLQLLCIGMPEENTQIPTCGKVAFYELDPSKQEYRRISRVLIMNQVKADVGSIRKALKDDIHERRNDRRSGALGFYGVGGLLWGGSIWFAAVKVVALNAMWPILIPITVFGGLLAIGLSKDGIESLDIFHRAGEISLLSDNLVNGSFDDQNGWNWSTLPTRIDSERFYDLLFSIEDLKSTTQ